VNAQRPESRAPKHFGIDNICKRVKHLAVLFMTCHKLFKRRAGTVFSNSAFSRIFSFTHSPPFPVISFLVIAALSATTSSWKAPEAAQFPPVESFEAEDHGYHRLFDVVAEDAPHNEAAARQGSLQSTSAPHDWKANYRDPSSERRIVLYEKNVPRSSSTRRVLTKKVLVRIMPQTALASLASIGGAKAATALAYAPGYFILESADPRGALELASALRRAPGVLSADPLLGKRQWPKSLPNDPILPNQWYLLGQGLNNPASIGINVTNAWSKYRGQGITIAIVDDSLQLTHPDLASNVLTNIDYDFRDNDDDPSPGGNDDYHGTTVAGVAAARGNNSLGITGVAYEASLLAVRLIGGDDQTDEQNAAAILHQNQIVHVSNNSWGPQDDGQTLEGPGKLMNLALDKAVREGRGGKGTIFVWPVGNGAERQDNANYDGYANSIYTIAVAAVDRQGKQSRYSEPGACVIVTAPSHDVPTADDDRIITTDLAGEFGLNKSTAEGDVPDTDYTRAFGGTSASTALVAGSAALILEANPLLGWRDVQEVIMRSAAKVDPSDADWMTNAAGLHFNHKFGAGLIDVGAAIDLAVLWKNLGPQTNIFLERTNLSELIPDNNAAGVTHSFDFGSGPSVRVEHVVVTASIAHPGRGDLAITLISPNGTRSRLAERHRDTNPDYNGWKLMSVFNWGEHSQGQWEVQVSDQKPSQNGTLVSLRVDLFGSAAPLLARPFLTPIGFENDKFKMLLAGIAGANYDVQGSSDLITWTVVRQITVAADSLPEIVELPDSGLNLRFYRAIRKFE
jgi:subtilisin family serine protease/subtilisin-like proprotein convertase family protein